MDANLDSCCWVFVCQLHFRVEGMGQMDLSFNTVKELKAAVPPVQVKDNKELPAALPAGKGM